VCKRWLRFENFLADMGERSFNQSIHRINVNKSYCKSNCVWIDKKEHGSLSCN